MNVSATALLLMLAGAVQCLELKYLMMLPMSVEHEFHVKYFASKSVDAVVRMPGFNTTLYPHKQGVFRITGNQSYLVGGKEDKALILTLTTNDDVVIGPFEATVMCSAHWAEYYAYLALPISALGTHYIISTYTPGDEGSAQMVITASEHDTDVTITLESSKPVKVLNNTYSKGQMIQFTLNQYQSLSFEADSDITGTVVRSSKTVAVFSGNFRARFPFDSPFKNMRDPTFEQLPPVSLLGQIYVVPKIPFCVYQEAKFIAAYEATVLHLSTEAENITLGETDQASLEVKQSLYLLSSKPVLVTTMCRGKTGNNPTSLTFVPPVERYKKLYPVPSPHANEVTQYLTIIACYADKTGLIVDKNLLSLEKPHWERIGNFAITTVAKPNGQYVVEADSPFALMSLVYETGVLASTSQLCLGFDLEKTVDSFCSVSLPSPRGTTAVSSSHKPTTETPTTETLTKETPKNDTSVTTYTVLLVVFAAVAVVAIVLLAVIIIKKRSTRSTSGENHLTDSLYASIYTVSQPGDQYDSVPADSGMTSGTNSEPYIHVIHYPTDGVTAVDGNV
ncbi:uncharacterized protein [Haliotis cracherodii]|uniref:uncharacterized protein isoform X2 n=1 Tax=Haliotis cracherodii TaxID=6455 RepID=UPI0039ECF57B